MINATKSFTMDSLDRVVTATKERMNTSIDETIALAEQIFIMLYEHELQKENLSSRKSPQELITLALNQANLFYLKAENFQQNLRHSENKPQVSADEQ